MTLELMPLAADEFDAWRDATRSRLIALRQESGMLVGDDAVVSADALLAEALAEGFASAASRTFHVRDGESLLGTVWLVATPQRLFVVDLAFTEPPGSDQMGALFDAVRTIARDRGIGRISVGVYRHDAATRALVEGRGFTLASIQMILEPLPEREVSSRVEVSPMTAERFPSFLAASGAAFAEDLVRSGRFAPEEAAAESHRQMLLELPDGPATAGQALFTASVDGVDVGILWLGVRRRDGRPHMFVLDIEVAADQRRKGYGRELMHAAEREAKKAGAASIGLHVFGFNTAAIDLYEDLGYRRTEESYFLDV